MGGQGIFVLVLCVIPVALVGYGTVKKAMPRWASVVSALSFLLVAMKTTNAPFDNVMMAGALGLILSIVLAIKTPSSKA